MTSPSSEAHCKDIRGEIPQLSYLSSSTVRQCVKKIIILQYSHVTAGIISSEWKHLIQILKLLLGKESVYGIFEGSDFLETLAQELNENDNKNCRNERNDHTDHHSQQYLCSRPNQADKPFIELY